MEIQCICFIKTLQKLLHLTQAGDKPFLKLLKIYKLISLSLFFHLHLHKEVDTVRTLFKGAVIY